MKKPGPDGTELPEDERKKTNGLSRHLSPVGALPECGPTASSCLAARRRTSEEPPPVPGTLFHNWAPSLSWGRGNDLVGERLLLLVESEGPGYAANPTGAACWYRMIAAGSTSLWSLSFRSPSRSPSPPPLVPSISVSLSLPGGRRVPLLSVSSSGASRSPLPSLTISFSRSLSPQARGSFSQRGNPSMVARNPPAASLPCCFSAFPFVSLSLPRAPHFLTLSFSLCLSRFFPPLPLPRGGWFIGFIGAPARALRILFSNYTVTCNRPCQLAAPFFRSSSARFFFFFSRHSGWRSDAACNPFEGIAALG